MTPQERQLVDELFDRLSKLENAPRDPDAIAAISDGLRKAPGAVYALVRGVLPRSTVASGLIYGEALWAVSYLGLLPALGLYALPEDRTLSQTAVMMAAHAVYGVTVAEADRQGVL